MVIEKAQLLFEAFQRGLQLLGGPTYRGYNPGEWENVYPEGKDAWRYAADIFEQVIMKQETGEEND